MKWRAKQSTANKRVWNLRECATKGEKVFLDKMFRAMPVKFNFQRAFIAGKGFVIVDFYVPSRHLAIEIDGGYHNTPEQQSKDRWKERYLESRGVNVIRFTNEQAIAMSDADVESAVCRDKPFKDHARRCKCWALMLKKKVKPKKDQVYAWYWQCPRCKRMVHDPQARSKTTIGRMAH